MAETTRSASSESASETVRPLFKNAFAKLPARDVERARGFYRETLGFEPTREMHGHLFYECGGAGFLVFPSSGAPSGTHDQLGFVVDDIDAAVAALRARGVDLLSYEAPPGCTFDDAVMDYGVVKAAWFHDSEGNLVSISQYL